MNHAQVAVFIIYLTLFCFPESACSWDQPSGYFSAPLRSFRQSSRYPLWLAVQAVVCSSFPLADLSEWPAHSTPALAKAIHFPPAPFPNTQKPEN
jgi:hypothetical protein